MDSTHNAMGNHMGQFQLALGRAHAEVTVTISTLAGQVMHQEQYHQAELLSLSLGNAPAGMYLVTISTPEGQLQVLKMIKE